MHKMLMATVVAAALIQGCTTAPGPARAPSVATPSVASSPGVSPGVGYVVSSNKYVRVTEGNCLRSVGWSSDNVVVECQGASDTPVVQQVAAPAPAPAPTVARLSYNGKALFEFDSAELSRNGRQELDSLVAKMKTHNGIDEVNVVGHADSIGEQSYNQTLSERRAATVRSYLMSALNGGVQVSSSGMGESVPVADNATAAGRQQNRRVEVKVDANVVQ